MKARRDTKQRQLVLNAVRSRSDHPTAEQIYESVHARDEHVSRGTVYRNLALLAEDCEINHVKVPGADRFDLTVELHCHLLCVRCGRVCDAPAEYRHELDEHVAAQTGYGSVRHRTVYEGICPDCLAAEHSEIEQEER